MSVDLCTTGPLNPYLVPRKTAAARVRNFKLAQAKVEQRVKTGGDRGDFWDRIMIRSANENETGDGMSKAEMVNNAAVLVLGGSETTSTTLSGECHCGCGSERRSTDDAGNAA